MTANVESSEEMPPIIAARIGVGPSTRLESGPYRKQANSVYGIGRAKWDKFLMLQRKPLRDWTAGKSGGQLRSEAVNAG
jgi:hypothetical protein